MKMNLIILSSKGFDEDDLFNFLDILDGRTYIAIKNRKIGIGKYKSKVLPDFDVHEIFLMRENHFDRLIYISDEGYKEFLNVDSQAIFTRFINSYRTVILSSLSQIAFLKSGLLAGRTITYNYDEYPQYLKYFPDFGVKLVTNADYVVDRNLITVKGRDSIYNLGEKLKEIEEELKRITI